MLTKLCTFQQKDQLNSKKNIYNYLIINTIYWIINTISLFIIQKTELILTIIKQRNVSRNTFYQDYLLVYPKPV